MSQESFQCCILGAGPAGLGVAVELVAHGVSDIVVVDKNAIIGGLSRTEIFDGVRFDVGPHRFYTKSEEVNKLWHDTLGNDFRPVNRLTRIYYKNKFFNYPVKAVDALIKLGPIDTIQAMISFAQAKLNAKGEPATFEDWITNNFGRKLYETFFKVYTEKVWGIACNQIGAEWAAQRIKGLDFTEVIRKALTFGKKTNVKTLVEQFDYPRLGAGQMYETMAHNAEQKGAQLLLSSRVTTIKQDNSGVHSIEIQLADGSVRTIKADHFFTSIPLTLFFKLLTPQASPEVLKAVSALYFRDHITVNMLIDGDNLFPDQWIYVHSPDVKSARIANYNNFSKEMVARKGKSAVSVEYFVFQSDDVWKLSDADLGELAISDLDRLKIVDKKAVEHTWVVRETESYPTYYLGFKDSYEVLRQAMDGFSNVSPIGRGGLYKYNNQDHSTISGILAARNYLKLPGTPYNVWDVNVDAEYLEGAKREE